MPGTAGWPSLQPVKQLQMHGASGRKREGGGAAQHWHIAEKKKGFGGNSQTHRTV